MISEDAVFVNPQEQHEEDQDDHDDQGGGESSGVATANLMELMNAASSLSSIGVRTPGSSSSSSSSMDSFSGSSSGNNSSDMNPFVAGLEVTLSVFKKKQDDELKQKIAEETTKHEERMRRHVMQLQAQKDLEQRVKLAQSQQALVGGATITQSDIFVVTDIKSQSQLKKAHDQQVVFARNSRIVRIETFFHRDCIQMFADGDAPPYFKDVDMFDDANGLDNEQRWAIFKAYAVQTKTAAVAGELSPKDRFLQHKLTLAMLANQTLMAVFMTDYRQRCVDVRAMDDFSEENERALTATLIRFDGKGLFVCDMKNDKEWHQLLTSLLAQCPTGVPTTLKSLGDFARNVSREIVSKQTFSGLIDASLRANAGKPAAQPRADAIDGDAGWGTWGTVVKSKCHRCNIEGHHAGACNLRPDGIYFHPDTNKQVNGRGQLVPFAQSDIGLAYAEAGRFSLGRTWAIDMSTVASIRWPRGNQGDFHRGGPVRGGAGRGRGRNNDGGRGRGNVGDRAVHFDNAQPMDTVHNDGGHGNGGAGRGFGRGRGRGNGGSNREKAHPYQQQNGDGQTRQQWRGGRGNPHFLLATNTDSTNDKIIHGYVSYLNDVMRIRALIDQGALSDNYVDTKIAKEMVSRGLAKKKKLCRCVNGHCKETTVRVCSREYAN